MATMPARKTGRRPKADPRNAAARAAEPEARTVCLGRIVGAHGVRGAVRIKSYTAAPDGLAAYGPLRDRDGVRRFSVAVTGRAKGVLLARIEGVEDRDGAEALRGTELHIARAALPTTDDDEYYHVDLIGLRAETADGAAFGRVEAIHDHGAGDIVEIRRPDAPPVLLPFTRAHVPTVDIGAGRMVVAPPEETT